MPTDYVGDPTATQSPSAAPTPGVAPTMRMPADGDADNAASVAQDFKVAADFLAWLMLPRAKSSDWVTAIMPFADARLRRRFIVDHFGLPRGEYLDWRERFEEGRTVWQTLAGNDTVIRSWELTQSGSGSNIKLNNPSGNFTTSPYLEFEIDNAAANTSEMKLADDANTMVWGTDMLAELDYRLDPVDSGAATTWVHGVAGISEHINTIANGAFFISAAGGNWHFRTISGGVNTDTDTGIAGTAGTAHHFLILPVGSNISDDSTTRCLAFVDGVLKANHTAHIPTGAQVHPIWGGFTSGVGGTTRKLHLGVPHWCQNISQSTP